MVFTTLNVKKETHAKLQEIKLCPTETADHLLNRLMCGYSEDEKRPVRWMDWGEFEWIEVRVWDVKK